MNPAHGKKWQVPNRPFPGGEQSERQSVWRGYRRPVELRQLEAFVAVADELHFGRAANRLHVGTPTLSELIRRLERELGTPLFTRTTRRVALTQAGTELLLRSTVILDDVAAAAAAVRRVAEGAAGTIRLGFTPPAGTVLAPHLVERFGAEAPDVSVQLRPMWLPTLSDALAAGDVDVSLTCGLPPDAPGISAEVFAAEDLLVGLRPSHRLAGQEAVALSDLAGEVLGVPPDTLFPAWAMSVRQALDAAGVSPRTVELTGVDLGGGGWTKLEASAWVLLIRSLVADRPVEEMAILPVRPAQRVPFTLQWNPDLAQTTAVARFVRFALTSDLPSGWHAEVDHLGHRVGG